MSVLKPASWRVLAILTGTTELEQHGVEGSQGLSVLELDNTDAAQVRVLRRPTVEEVKRALLQWRPNFVYFSGKHDVPDAKTFGVIQQIELCASSDAAPLEQALYEIFSNGVDIHTVYLDAPGMDAQVPLLASCGITNILHWRLPDVLPALPAAHFAHSFFAALRTPTVTISEAFAVAQSLLHLHLCQLQDGDYALPPTPSLHTADEIKMPDNCSVPLPASDEMDFGQGVGAVVPGWNDVRLLAPRAELRLLLVGDGLLLMAKRLAYLGEALRALLVLEARTLTLRSHTPSDRAHANLPEAASQELLCQVTTQSGAHLKIILAGPPSVLGNWELTQHALRHTLTADAFGLQFRLPPAGLGLPAPRTTSTVARGLPTIDTMVVAPLWAVVVLRALAQDSKYRGLTTLGIVGVGSTPVSQVTESDYYRYATIVTGSRPEASTNGVDTRQWNGAVRTDTANNGGAAGAGSHSAAFPQSAAPGLDTEVDAERLMKQMEALGYTCARPPIASCTKEQFMQDLITFTEVRRKKRITPAKFPDAVLNGKVLDLYNLYREVCRLGGFRMGRLINWKGQVFPRMSNWTADNKMTGVGNALKRHYANWLYHYELCHPEDLTTKRCPKCGHNQETASEWLICTTCHQSFHFSCDERPDLGAYSHYHPHGAKLYTCSKCSSGDRGDSAPQEASLMDQDQEQAHM